MLRCGGVLDALLIWTFIYAVCEATTGIVSYSNSTAPGTQPTSNSSSTAPQPTAYSDPVIEAYSSCDSSWGNWQIGWLQHSAANAPAVWPAQTTSSLSSGISCVGGVTTLCDGVPRCMKAVATTKTIWGTGWNDLEPWNQPDPIPPYPSPTPACKLSDEQCGDLWGAYDSLAAQYMDLSMTMPYCSEWQGWGSMIDPCDSCYVTANAVQLLYWPVTVKNQGVCSNGTGSTITATPTIPGQPNTATWQNKTIVTSPSVYLSFASLYAYGTKWYPSGLGYGICGSTARNVLVPIKPEAVTSYRGAAGALAGEDPGHPNMPYSFNYADLNYRVLNDSYSIPLVPKDAYSGMEDCYNGVNCSTIYPGWYKPEIGLSAVEAAFTDVDPKWSKCGFNFGGFYDPPVALTTASNLNAPTPTEKPVPETTTPAPGQTTQQPTRTAGGDDPGSGGQGGGSGAGGGPKTPHLESTVPAGAPSPQPDHTSDGSSGSGTGSSGGDGGSDDGSGTDGGSGSEGGSGSDDGGSDDPDSSTPGSTGQNSSGDSDPNDPSGPSDPSDPGSSGQGGSNGGSGSKGGTSDPNDGDAGSTAVITGSNGQSMTISQLPTTAGSGGHGSSPKVTGGSAFTVVGQGTTISVGGSPATISGIEISAAPGGIATRTAGAGNSGAGAGGWSTVPLTPAAGTGGAQATGAVITLPHHSAPITATEVSSGVFVVPESGSSPAITLSQGGSAATVDGVTVSAGPTGIVVGGGDGRASTTVAASAIPVKPLAEATEVVITPSGGSTPITASEIASGVFVVPASGNTPAVTLSAGGNPATINGVVLSAGPSGVVVEGGDGHPITTVAASTVALATEAVFSPNGDSAVSAIEIRPGVFVIPGTDGGAPTTISDGGSAITVDGTVVSAGSSGLVVGGKTVPASTVALPTGAESTGLGGYIITGLDGGSSATGTEPPSGGAAHVKVERWRYAAILMALVVAMVYV